MTSKVELLSFLGDFRHFAFATKTFVLNGVISQPVMSWRSQRGRK
jgi:hypothetical protein